MIMAARHHTRARTPRQGGGALGDFPFILIAFKFGKFTFMKKKKSAVFLLNAPQFVFTGCFFLIIINIQRSFELFL